MITIDARRYAKALERVKMALNAAGLNQSQRAELVARFEQGWKVAAGSVTAQEKHTQGICDLIARLGNPPPTDPGRPARNFIPMAA